MISGDEARIRRLELIGSMSGSIGMVHLDDLCRAEMFVAENSSSSGRYICCSLNTTAAQLAHFLAAKYPQYSVKTHRYQRNASISVSVRWCLSAYVSVGWLDFRFDGLPEKPRVCVSSAKLIGEGFEYKYKTLDQIYDDVVDYGRALGILPY